jgi:dolichol-phosphate mannosyltransferase
MTDCTVSVILPCYNECGSIVPLIRRLSASVTFPLEILVVDDNSQDGTAQLVKDNFDEVGHVRVIERIHERGLTSAINRGIQEASGEIVVWMDCDLSMPPEKARELITEVVSGRCDAAVGSRYVKGGSDVRYRKKTLFLWTHVVFSYLITRFTMLCLCSSFRDWTSGFIAVRKDLQNRYPLKGDYGEYFIRLIHALISNGYRVKEIPYTLTPRQSGTSKTAGSIPGLIQRGSKYVYVVIELMFQSRGPHG